MALPEYHLKPLPSGVGIYAERLGVAGIQHRRAAAARFIRGKELGLELEPEPSNPHDRHAMRVIGLWRGWFRKRRTLLGYVPRDVARVVAEGQFWPDIQPRLLKTYLGDGGFVEVQFQLVGSKARAREFRAAFATDGHYTGAVEKVKYLKAEGRLDEAVELLLPLVDDIETEASRGGQGYGVAPWYYEQLAIIYRKLGRAADEVSILERYMAQPHSPGVGPTKLAERLRSARERARKLKPG